MGRANRKGAGRGVGRRMMAALAHRPSAWFPLTVRETLLGALVVAAALLAGCQSAAPPPDVDGKLPQDVMLEVYTAVLEGRYADAEKRFSPAFVKTFMTDRNLSLEQYTEYTRGWKVEWLKTELVGNDYNDDLWRVRTTPDAGRGKSNPAGAVNDLYLIDGHWKVAFWDHFPKS